MANDVSYMFAIIIFFSVLVIINNFIVLPALNYNTFNPSTDKSNVRGIIDQEKNESSITYMKDLLVLSFTGPDNAPPIIIAIIKFVNTIFIVILGLLIYRNLRSGGG